MQLSFAENDSIDRHNDSDIEGSKDSKDHLHLLSNYIRICSRSLHLYQKIVKNHKQANGLWGVSFPFVDKLGKSFGVDRATGASCEDHVEVVDNLHNDNEAINPDKDGEDEENEEDDSVQLAQPSPQPLERTKKEKTPIGKGKKRMSEVTNLTSTFTNMSSNISSFMSGMNPHLETIASTFTTTQQHEQVIMACELHLDQK
ncbi:hypothetical protein Cgig2_027953 [Carnegiea gigantea]|uniref:Uncharacterized protein n=1 Tax=Carnegiea gigantea TaxID=171969 RepID=A0A9Q1JMV1_9CARY|nr:hypothetical protein Cgig2_027953 [Carnegiea gigantea]